MEPFREFDIQLKYTDLEIFPADDYYVKYKLYDLEAPVYSVEEEIFTFLEGERQENREGSGTYFFWMGNTGLGWEAEPQNSKGYVKLYLPADAYVSRATVWSDYGDLEAGNLKVDDFDMNLTCGNADMDSWQGRQLDIYLKNGTVHIQNGIEAKESCTIESRYGDINIGSFYAPEGNITMENGKLEADIKDGTQLTAENHYGDVYLRTEGELKEYDSIFPRNTEIKWRRTVSRLCQEGEDTASERKYILQE